MNGGVIELTAINAISVQKNNNDNFMFNDFMYESPVIENDELCIDKSDHQTYC